MTNDLTIDVGQIVITKGSITFPDFETIKEQALKLSDEIAQVEVNEETVKTSKKLLAAVNGRIKSLEDMRISIKKEMLSPYTEFEQQVKEIVSIVKCADSLVRDQVKELEEIERDSKSEAIRFIFNKRIKQYNFSNLFTFDHFVTAKHLNKSTSMKSIETEMVEWLEKKDNDMQVINTLPNAKRVLTEYLDTKDVATAIRIVNEYDERLKKVDQVKPVVSKSSNKSFVITLTDEKDLKLVEMFMNQNKIDYKVEL